MSFSMLEPEEEPRCECKYDEARDTMDRDDCPFHADLFEEATKEEPREDEYRQPEPRTNEIKRKDRHAA